MRLLIESSLSSSIAKTVEDIKESRSSNMIKMATAHELLSYLSAQCLTFDKYSKLIETDVTYEGNGHMSFYDEFLLTSLSINLKCITKTLVCQFIFKVCHVYKYPIPHLHGLFNKSPAQ